MSINDVPGPKSVPIIGSLWNSWSFAGKYAGMEFHEACTHKYLEYGAVVRENVAFNYPLIHLFDR